MESNLIHSKLKLKRWKNVEWLASENDRCKVNQSQLQQFIRKLQGREVVFKASDIKIDF